MIDQYVRTPGRGGSTTMTFPSDTTYIKGVTGDQTITSTSVSYSHGTAGSYDLLHFNNAEIYRGGWNVPLGITITSGSGTAADPYVTVWSQNHGSGELLSNIITNDQISGIDVTAITNDSITFAPVEGKCARIGNASKCILLSKTSTFNSLTADTAIYIEDKSKILKFIYYTIIIYKLTINKKL